MGSGLGYWVKVSNNGQIIYDENIDLTASKEVSRNISTSKGFAPTATWVNIYSYDLTLDGEAISSGTEIIAFNERDQKVGSFTMKQNGQFGFMNVYGDDPTTSEIDGMKAGENFYLSVNGVNTEEKFTWTSSGDKLEISGLSSKTTSGTNLPDSYALLQNYPNPFNPSTNIDFNLPKSGKATIEIFNLLGKLVATPYDKYTQAGLTTIEWDGRNSDGTSVASGIYFYRLTADKFTETKKMTLIK
jgi:flagellar hook assembly protein FlgD